MNLISGSIRGDNLLIYCLNIYDLTRNYTVVIESKNANSNFSKPDLDESRKKNNALLSFALIFFLT